MVTIEVAGQALTLLPQKAALLPDSRTLLIADAHIGKATSFRALGVPVDYPEDEPARYHGAVLPDLTALPPAVDLRKDRRVQVWLEATRLLKRHFGDAIHVRGNCDQCPFSLAGSLRG